MKFNFSGLLNNLFRLFKLVWVSSPSLLLSNIAVTLGAALIPAAQLYIGKLIIDELIQEIAQPTLGHLRLIWLVGTEFGLVVLQGVFTHSESYFSQVLSDHFNLYSNRVLLDQAVRLDLAHYEMPEFYDTMQRAQQDGGNYPVRVLGTFTSLCGQIASFLGTLSLLLTFSPLVMLLLLLTSVPAFWIGVKYSGRRFWLVRTQTQTGRRAEYIRKILTENSYVKEVRLFNLGPYLLGQWQDIRTRFNKETRTLQTKHSLARFLIGIFANLGYFGAYALVISRALAGLISVGSLAMYAGAFQLSQNAIRGILTSLASIYEYNLYISQYFEFLDLSPKIVSSPNAKTFPTPIAKGLSMRNLSFTYPGASFPTLHNINLNVSSGESIALVGLNGSGKTTLLKLIGRFYDVTEGEIQIDSINLQDFKLDELRRNIGVIFQDFGKYSFSIKQNIGFGDIEKVDSLTRIEVAATDAGASEFINKFEQKYETVLGKTFTNGVELSGGQWQKIGISRAFMAPAPILILDEPTAAVDALTEYDLFLRFRELTKGKMTFLVSHRFSTVRMADRIVVLEGGTITEVGTHQELLKLNKTYAKMFRMQAESYATHPEV